MALSIATKGQSMQQAIPASEDMEVDGDGAGEETCPISVEAPGRWASALVPGVAECTAEVAVQQVRAARVRGIL